MTNKDQEYMKTVEDYRNSIDVEVLEFIKNVLNGDNRMKYVTVAFIPDSAAKTIEELTGKHVDGNRVVLDINAIKHIENRHGTNGKQDSSMKNIEDLARIGYVIMNYDDINYEGLTTTGFLDENGNASPMVLISKRINGTYYVVETVNASKLKKNYIISAYIEHTKKEQQSNP